MFRVKYILASLLFLCFFKAYSQQPSFYIIGKDELSDINVYSLFQDDHANVWISSNRGLIKYDGYDFKEYHSDIYQNRSLFGLRSDNNGKVFCYNLSGQFFHVENDSLKLYYQVPSSLVSTRMNFNFDNTNQLIIICKKVLAINNNREASTLIDKHIDCWDIPINENNELVFLYSQERKIAYYKSGKIRTVQLPVTPELEVGNRIGFRANLCNNPNYIIGKYEPVLFKIEDSTLIPINLPAVAGLQMLGKTNYITSHSDIWITSRNKGACVFDTVGTSIYQDNRILMDYFLSDFMEDREGNLWIGTFGKGIVIIPNKDVSEYSSNNLMDDDIINVIEADNSGNLFFGGLNGILYRLSIDKQLEIIRKEGQTFEIIHHLPENNSLLLNSPEHVVYNLETKEDSIFKTYTLKNVCPLSDSEHLLATSSGVILFTTNGNTGPYYSLFRTFEDVETFNGNLSFNLSRCAAVAYDEKRQIIWAATFRGLIKITKSGTSEVLHKGKPISTLDIQMSEDILWIATVGNGILRYQNDEIKPYLNENNGLYSNLTNQILKEGNTLYIAEKGAFQAVDIQTKEIKSFTHPDGLNSNSIRDFEVTEDWIWLASGAGIQKFRFQDISQNHTPPHIEFNRFEVNDKSHSLQDDSIFNYFENRIEFHFVAKAYRHRGLLNYQYMLAGLENEDWQTVSLKQNFIKYPSLPPGEYTFMVKAKNENNIESETLKYAFKIKNPYWKTWWFYLICALCLGGIVFIFFLIRIGVVKERLELEKQIKASEVTAIKAQMNPHFVFNALNSVQDLIMQKDIRGSTTYLGKFADLMRKTLDVSELELIPLNDEIEILELYLDLEKLRFVDGFRFSIEADTENHDRESLMIHSMLLQPYVENAIKHGLLHKDGLKILGVKFYIEDQKLICEIVDNGIGRKASLEINKRRARFHRSFATQANRKRIDLINELSNHTIELSISDIMHEGKIAGTKVELRLPLVLED